MYNGWSKLVQVMHEERIQELLKDSHQLEPRWKIWPQPMLSRLYSPLRSLFRGRKSSSTYSQQHYADCAQPEKAS